MRELWMPNMLIDFIMCFMWTLHAPPQKKWKWWLISRYLKVFVHRIPTLLTSAGMMSRRSWTGDKHWSGCLPPDTLFTSAFVIPWQKYKCHWGTVSLTGIAVDGPSKISNHINGNQICLIKKTGKVKALDEELYSEFIHAVPVFVMSANCPIYLAVAAPIRVRILQHATFHFIFNLPKAIMQDEMVLNLEINNEGFHSSNAPSIHVMLIESMTKPLSRGCSHRERFTEPGRGAPHTLRPGSHPLGHTRRAQRRQQPPTSLGQRQRCERSLALVSLWF